MTIRVFVSQSPWTLEECSRYATNLATGILESSEGLVDDYDVAERIHRYIVEHLQLDLRFNTYRIRDAIGVGKGRTITVTCYARSAIDVLADILHD